jgi:hypothetical protein
MAPFAKLACAAALLAVASGVRAIGDDIADPEEYNVTGANSPGQYVFGWLLSASEACYPRKWMPFKVGPDLEPCTVQCTTKAGMCWCPHKGKTCVSVFSKNPGLLSADGVPGHYMIKMDKKTNAWELLNTVPDKMGNYVWKRPSRTGLSWMDPRMITDPWDKEKGADLCDPNQAAAYMKSKGIKMQ